MIFRNEGSVQNLHLLQQPPKPEKAHVKK